MQLRFRQRIYLMALLNNCTLMMFSFAMTRLFAEQGAPLYTMGSLAGVAYLSYGLGSVASGRLSDAMGRRKVIALGAGLSLCFLYVATLGTRLAFLLTMTGLVGGAISMVFPPLIAWLSEREADTGLGPARSRVLIAFCIAWNIGTVLGALCGGLLFAVSHKLPLLTALLFMAALLVLALRADGAGEREPPGEEENSDATALPVPASPAGDGPVPPAPTARVRQSFAYLGWIANIGGAFNMSAILFLFPSLAAHLGISSSVHGLMLATSRLTMIAVYFLLHLTLFWRYRLSAAFAAQFLAAAGVLLLVRGGSVPVLTAGLVLASVLTGYNYFASIFYSTTGFGTEKKGIASGLHEASLAAGFGGGAVAGGILGSLQGLRAPYRLGLWVLAVLWLIQCGVYLARSRQLPAAVRE
jgi:predicted MFS family arabinose efflux permease